MMLNKPVAGTRGSDHGLRVTFRRFANPEGVAEGQGAIGTAAKTDVLNDVGYYLYTNRIFVPISAKRRGSAD